MAFHQKFGEFAVALGDGFDDTTVFTESPLGATGGGAETVTVHPYHVIKITQQHLGKFGVAAAGGDSVVKVVIPFGLVIGLALGFVDHAFVGIEGRLKIGNFLIGHTLGCLAGGQTFHDFAYAVELHQLGGAD